MEDSLPINTYQTLKHAYNTIKKELHEKLADSGITWPQFHALYHIEQNGTPVNELARELKCNASNMTGLIDRMIENNWVYREHSEKDRRVWLVKLTDKGIDLKARMMPLYNKNISERMSILDERELATLKTLLEKLIGGEAEL